MACECDHWCYSPLMAAMHVCVCICVDAITTSARHVRWSSTKSRHDVLCAASKPVAFLTQPKVHAYYHLMDLCLWSYHSASC